MFIQYTTSWSYTQPVLACIISLTRSFYATFIYPIVFLSYCKFLISPFCRTTLPIILFLFRICDRVWNKKLQFIFAKEKPVPTLDFLASTTRKFVLTLYQLNTKYSSRIYSDMLITNIVIFSDIFYYVKL